MVLDGHLPLGIPVSRLTRDSYIWEAAYVRRPFGNSVAIDHFSHASFSSESLRAQTWPERR
jgi:hypothetical protein